MTARFTSLPVIRDSGFAESESTVISSKSLLQGPFTTPLYDNRLFINLIVSTIEGFPLARITVNESNKRSSDR